jgi:hypothetical protein
MSAYDEKVKPRCVSRSHGNMAAEGKMERASHQMK